MGYLPEMPISSAGGSGISINIPARALCDRTIIELTICRDPAVSPVRPIPESVSVPPGPGLTLVSPVLECTPHGLHFLLPVTIRLPHCSSGPLSELQIWCNDSADGRSSDWVAVTDIVARTREWIEFQVTHFTFFAATSSSPRLATELVVYCGHPGPELRVNPGVHVWFKAALYAGPWLREEVRQTMVGGAWNIGRWSFPILQSWEDQALSDRLQSMSYNKILSITFNGLKLLLERETPTTSLACPPEDTSVGAQASPPAVGPSSSSLAPVDTDDSTRTSSLASTAENAVNLALREDSPGFSTIPVHGCYVTPSHVPTGKEGWACQFLVSLEEEEEPSRRFSPLPFVQRLMSGSSSTSSPRAPVPPSSRLEVSVLLPAATPSAKRRRADDDEPTGTSSCASKRHAESGSIDGARDLLIFTCSPTGAQLGGLDAEVADIAQHLPLDADIRHQRGGDPDLLRQYLLHKPTRVFIFAGHGNVPSGNPYSYTLGFTNPVGGLVMPDPQIIVDLLKSVKELVILDGCKTESLGGHLCDAGVPAVICWRTLVHNQAAPTFMAAIFEFLKLGHDIAAAFGHAKNILNTMMRPVHTTTLTHPTLPHVNRWALVDPEVAQPPPLYTPPPDAAGVPVLLRPGKAPLL